MFERISRLYHAGRLDTAGVEKAVLCGWITQAQAKEITTDENNAQAEGT